MTYKAPQGRFYFVVILGLLVCLALILRLLKIQVVEGKTYKEIATRQQQFCLTVSPQRGAIYDRNFQLLACNLSAESFFAIPESVSNLSLVAEKFSSITPSSPQEIAENLKRYKNFAWLKRKVDREQGEQITSWKLRGVYSKKESKRAYPFGHLTEEVLGFTDMDNNGSAGIEYQYNQILQGKTGKILVNRDALRKNFALKSQPLVESENGNSLVLTLDLRIQAIVKEELSSAVESTQAEGGTSIWMDPTSGEILAMAYCSNRDTGLCTKNKTISDNFEPGSTFKIVTAVAALEEKIKEPDDSIYAENGEYMVNNRIIHDVHKYKWLTFRQSIAYSSNIAVSKIAKEVGKKNMYKYARNLGFGLKTGIDLPGESKGFLLSPKKYSDYVLSTFAIGQGVSLNSLQLINAYAAVANNGNLMKPYLVKAILNEQGDTVKEFHPQKIRQAISPRTCKIMNDFLKAVVDSGTGNTIKAEDLDIAGKTGTAQKPDLDVGGYEKGHFVASFVGYFPASQPKYVGIVCIDSPKGKHFGSETAAPVFRNIAQRLAALQEQPLLSANISLPKKDDGSKALTVYALTKTKEASKNPIYGPIEPNTIPNALGMTVRQATKLFSEKKISFKIKGSGIVKNQTPSPGSEINPGQVCLLYCQTD